MAAANPIDRAIDYFAPGWGAARARARAVNEAISTATALYDGAARSWRTAGRRISSTSANAETMMSLPRLRDVSRDLRRNNALAANAITVIDSHVVGAGIIPTIDVPGKRLKTKIQSLIKKHLESTDIDAEGVSNYYGLQSLIMSTVAESGEALIVRYRATDRRLSVPLQVRVYEPDYLNHMMNGVQKNGNTVFDGIEIDTQTGARVAYHIFDEHPGGGVTWHLPRSHRVEAADVKHVYRRDRPGQLRGVPWCAPVMMTLWDLHEYEDAELVRQKIAACFAVFLEGQSTETNLADQIGNDKTRAGTIIDKLEPGIIQKLPPGVKATLASPPTVQGYADFVRSRGHNIAAGYGVPYELLSTDNSDVSFISGRLGLIQFHKNVDRWRWHTLIPHACDGIMGWFLEAASITLGTSLRDVVVKHTPPRREMIEPSKEIPAARDAIRSGLSSLPEELRSLGFDPDVIFGEIEETNKIIDAKKLGLDSDGRRPLAFKLPIEAPANDG